MSSSKQHYDYADERMDGCLVIFAKGMLQKSINMI